MQDWLQFATIELLYPCWWRALVTLFTNGACTMQQFMWQLDIAGVAHFVMDCFDVLDDIPSNQP